MIVHTFITWIICVSHLVFAVNSRRLNSRLDNGLALTPPMGWNTYNHYSCAPNQTIAHSNAQALVDLGLQAAGYHYVTIDCGWTLPNRTDNGTLTWNPERFPDGYLALGNFLHDLGLKFGVYSDGGIKMCMTGDPVQVGSLGHEILDVQTFASWGADLLKYDNCFSDAATDYPNVNYEPSTSPSSHQVTMSNAIKSQTRPMLFQICEWGVDFPSAWAPPLGNSWRITNDIIGDFKTIPRILNQAVPQTDFAGPDHWLDLDMLEVGNEVFTVPEEQTHFSLWAIIKSPLVIGAALKDEYSALKPESLTILKNADAISYNQDSLGVAASFRRRWTEEGYEVWAGPLSGNRTVVALINLLNETRELTLDFPDVGFQSAGLVKDIWNKVTSKVVLTSYTTSVNPHGTMLLELVGTSSANTYDSRFVEKPDSRNSTTYKSIYALTTSSNYSLELIFSESSKSDTLFSIKTCSKTVNHTLSSGSRSLIVPLCLITGNNNTITIYSPLPPTRITVTAPKAIFYPSTIFQPSGAASLTTCHANLCLPVGSKIGFISPNGTASATFTGPGSPQTSKSSSKLVDIYFCNNDIALATSWTTGTNTRNMTIAVNGITTRIEVPLSGRSSELFSLGKGWEDTGIFRVLLEGFRGGGEVDEVVIGNVGGEKGVQPFGADFVGMSVFW